MPRVIKTYGRHRQRMIAADLWSSEDDHKNVFSFSSNDSTSNNETIEESKKPKKKVNVKGIKRGRPRKNKENVDTPERQRDKKKRNLGRHSILVSCTDTSTGSDGIFESLGRKVTRQALKDKNGTDINEATNPTKKKPIEKKTRACKKNKKIEKDVEIVSATKSKPETPTNNFSEFDEYSFLISDSPLNLGNNVVVDLTKPSVTPDIETRGRRKTRAVSSVETSTPNVGKGPKTNLLKEMQSRDSDISQIAITDSPLCEAPSGREDLDRISDVSNQSDDYSENISKCAETLKQLCLSSAVDVHDIKKNGCSVVLEKLSDSATDRLTTNHRLSTSHRTLESVCDSDYDASQSLFDASVDVSNITTRRTRNGSAKSEVESMVEEESEDDDNDDEDASSQEEESDLSDICEEGEEEDEEEGEESGADVSRYMLNTEAAGEMDVSLEEIEEAEEGNSALSAVSTPRSGSGSSSDNSLSTPEKSTHHLDERDICRSFKLILTPGKYRRSGKVVSPRSKVLEQCGQEDYVSFSDCFTPAMMRNAVKIGEGVYGEVFRSHRGRNTSVALKIIPIEGDFPVNDEPQKTFAEMLPEIVISSELSALQDNEENMTDNFIQVNKVSCVQGAYPDHLLSEWDKYDKRKQSENDRPDVFNEDQLFIVFEFADGGSDLENHTFEDLHEAKSVLQQVTAALAVAEECMQFEHRDLHWGNVLVKPTEEETVKYCLNGEEFELDTHGVQVNIIDFTMSRLRKDGCTVFCNLATDDTLFLGEGDYQFDIYRKMKEINGNEWESHHPQTNVYWLHYLADKLFRWKKYPSTDRGLQKEFRNFMKEARNYASATHLFLECSFFKC